MSRKALDGLSAMVMVAQARPEDLVRVKLNEHAPRRYCMKHLEFVAHRLRHKRDAKKQQPGPICLLIARDDITEHVRKGEWLIYDLTAPTDDTWHECVHCGVEAAMKHRHALHG